MVRKSKLFNMTELAEKIGVTRQAIYKWIEKGWIKPKRDYRDYPVFTTDDVKMIIRWMEEIR